MEYRQLTRDEIKLFRKIDRREIVKQVYYHRDGQLELEDEFYDIPKWSDEKIKSHIRDIQELYDRGGVVYGAFEGDEFAGMITLDVKFIGPNKDQLNLAGLWISKDHRKKGVASKLIDIISTIARNKGANALYVSATESKNTVKFYTNRGFRLAEHVDPELYAKEPRDIHMVLELDSNS